MTHFKLSIPLILAFFASWDNCVKLELMKSKTRRGFSPIIVIILIAVCLLILGFAYYFVVLKNILTPPKQLEYQNPFQKTPSYENPFTDYKNPFEDLE